MWRKAAAGVAAAGAGAYALYPDEVEGVADGYYRAAVTIGNSALVMADYRRNLHHMSGAEPEYKALKAAFDERTSARLLSVCLEHGGCYTKLGQHLSTFNHILPRQYTSRLSVLQNKAKARPFAVVRKTIEQELARPLEAVFRDVAAEPLAAASLAQVHRGTLLDGREVCVKVQYPHLKRQVEYDLFVLGQLVKVVSWLFPEFDLQWLLPEAKRALFEELDFAQEGRNADLTRAVLRDWVDAGVLRIPEVLWGLTTDRVLAMELVDTGCKVNDADGARELGAEPHDVAEVFCQIFAEMMFGQGWLHVDPHPGNVWLRKTHAGDRPVDRQRPWQLVLFDHGSYYHLSEDFRAKYRELWRAMMLMDQGRIIRAGESLGAGEFAQYFPLMFTYRPIFSTKRLGFQGVTSKEDKRRLRAELSKHKKEEWTRFMEGLPRDMLFVMRVNDMMRSINKDLGGTTRMRLGHLGAAAVRGHAQSKYEGDGRLRTPRGDVIESTSGDGQRHVVKVIPAAAAAASGEGGGVISRWRKAFDAYYETTVFELSLWVMDLILQFAAWAAQPEELRLDADDDPGGAGDGVKGGGEGGTAKGNSSTEYLERRLQGRATKGPSLRVG